MPTERALPAYAVITGGVGTAKVVVEDKTFGVLRAASWRKDWNNFLRAHAKKTASLVIDKSALRVALRKGHHLSNENPTKQDNARKEECLSQD